MAYLQPCPGKCHLWATFFLGFFCSQLLPMGSMAAKLVDSSTGNAAGGATPFFISDSQTVRAEIGENVRLPCEVEELGSYIVLWKKGGVVLTAGSLMISRDERFRLVDGYTLEIHRLRSQDSGEYTCEINTSPPMGQTVTLDVLVPPTVKAFPTEGRLTVKKGEVVSLECVAEGNPVPTITWTRSKRLLPNGADSLEGGSLPLGPAGRHHAGKYVCTADNTVGEPVEASVEVHVMYSPDIEVERNWIHAGVGKEAYLTCSVHAEPAANVLWFRNDRILVPSDNRIMETSGDKHTLIIREVMVHDFGNYSCVADNSLGKAQQTVELSGRPNRAIFRSDPVGRFRDSYNLTWTTDSYAPIESFRLMFRKLEMNDTYESAGIWSSVMIPAEPYGAVTHVQSYNIHYLDAASVYEAVVQAKNKYGYSDPSELFQFYTLGSEFVPHKELESSDISEMAADGMTLNNSANFLQPLSILLMMFSTLLLPLL